MALLAGCGARALTVELSFSAASCVVDVPGGGSLLFELSTGETVCGACLAVDAPLVGPDALEGFLRAKAPACSAVAPQSTLRFSLTAWPVPGCPTGAGQPAARFCASAPDLRVPDGRSDETRTLEVACDPGCGVVCRPGTCFSLSKNCGMVADGCGGMIDCGSCRPPTTCGGGGLPNVCGRK